VTIVLRKQGVGVVALIVLLMATVVCLNCETKTPEVQKSSATKAGSVPKQASNLAQPEPEWRVVSTVGSVKMVYMSEEGLKDKNLIAQALHSIVGSRESVQVFFFDERASTPMGFPMTDKQMLHWKAKYSRNLNTGHEEFSFIEVVNPQSSPPGLKETKASIRPGYVE